MSEIQDKVSIISKVELKGGEVKFTEEKGFVEYNKEYGWLAVPAVDVSLDDLLLTYEDLVNELSDKEIKLGKVKEKHLKKEFDILTTFDFKKAYGKDNEKIRKGHIHNELLDLEKTRDDLELSINWIKNYIPLLREVVRSKQ